MSAFQRSWGSPLPFTVACGPSAQLQGLPAEGRRTAGGHKHFFMMS